MLTRPQPHEAEAEAITHEAEAKAETTTHEAEAETHLAILNYYYYYLTNILINN